MASCSPSSPSKEKEKPKIKPTSLFISPLSIQREKPFSHLSRYIEVEKAPKTKRVKEATGVMLPHKRLSPPPIDLTPPTVEITSPANFSTYQSSITVKGCIRDKGIGTEGIRRATWQINNTQLKGELKTDSSGNFTFKIDTTGYSNVLQLHIKAEDFGGNKTSKNLYLFDDGRGPSITIISPNDRDNYLPRVSVRGRVGNLAEPMDSPDEVMKLVWYISSPEHGLLLSPEKLVHDRGGYFEFAFNTAGMPEEIILHVKAEDKNGHTTNNHISLYDDRIPPYIHVIKPEQMGLYQDKIIVAGVIKNSEEAKADTTLDIGEFTYSILNVSIIAGNINFDKSGNFLFTIPSKGLSGIQTLVLKAIDTHGNTSIKRITIDKKLPRISENKLKSEEKTIEKKPLLKPNIHIDRMGNKIAYRTRINLSGRVTDSKERPKSAGNIKNLSFSISGTKINGEIPFDTRGAFKVSIPIEGMHGLQIVVLKAKSRDGITVSQSIQVEEDKRGPYIVLESPTDKGFYGKSVIIRGQISNSAEDTGNTDEVKKIQYRIDGSSSISNVIGFDREGNFDMEIPIVKSMGHLKLTILAEDKNEHISSKTVDLLDGKLKPEVTVTSPINNSFYGALLYISGNISDPYKGNVYHSKDSDKDSGYEKVKNTIDIFSAGFSEKASKTFRKTIKVDLKGNFGLLIPTKEFSGTQVILVSSKLFNGKSAEVSVRVKEGKSGIPSFKVIPQDKAVKLNWLPIPVGMNYKVTYTITYTDDGTMPAEDNGNRAYVEKSPFILDNLENGRRYRFLLKGILSADTSNLSKSNLNTSNLSNSTSNSKSGLKVSKLPLVILSETKDSIPLSPLTLIPTVTGEYQSIRLSWNKIQGAESYDVLKSDNADASYREIAHTLRGTIYLDKDVKYGKTYYYKIRPSLDGSIVSMARIGKSLALPETKLETKSGIKITDGQNIVIDGSYAYVADGRSGLKIVDISDPNNIVTVGSLKTNNAFGITVGNTYSYIADGERGIKSIDTTEPTAPQLIGTRKTREARKIVLRGSYAYVADGRGGIKIMDLSNPRHPVRVSSISLSDARDLATYRNYLLAADKEEGLVILDISHAVKPEQVGSLHLGPALRVYVHRNMALVALGKEGIRIVDISDPKKPVVTGSYDTFNARGIVARGDYAYVADGKGGFKVLDISNPAHSFQFDAVSDMDARSLAISGDYIYILTPNYLKTVKNMIIGNSFQIASCRTPGKAYGITIMGNTALLADHRGGISIVDISKPETIDNSSIIFTMKNQYAESVTVSKNTVFIADGPGGIKIAEILFAHDNVSLEIISKFYTGGHAYNIAVNGNLAYSVSGNTGLNVIDVSDRKNPKALSIMKMKDARDIIIHGSTLFIADYREGLKVIDVSDSENPKLISSVDIPGASGTALHGKILFVLGSKAIYAVDITNILKLMPVKVYRTEYGQNIKVKENYLYLSEGYKGFKVFHIGALNTHSNTANPANEKTSLINSGNTSLTLVSRAKNIFSIDSDVKDGYAYIVDSNGLKVIKILIPQWLKQ